MSGDALWKKHQESNLLLPRHRHLWWSLVWALSVDERALNISEMLLKDSQEPTCLLYDVFQIPCSGCCFVTLSSARSTIWFDLQPILPGPRSLQLQKAPEPSIVPRQNSRTLIELWLGLSGFTFFLFPATSELSIWASKDSRPITWCSEVGSLTSDQIPLGTRHLS